MPNRDSQRFKSFEKFAANRVLEEFSKSDSAQVIRALTAKDARIKPLCRFHRFRAFVSQFIEIFWTTDFHGGGEFC